MPEANTMPKSEEGASGQKPGALSFRLNNKTQRNFWGSYWIWYSVQDHINRIKEKWNINRCAAYLASLPSPALVLDLGCGVGSWMIILSGLTNHKFVGVECSPQILEHAVSNLRAQASSPMPRFIAGVAEELPFQAEQFDVIVTNSFVEYVADLRLVRDELVRILKPKGHWFVGSYKNRLLEKIPGPAVSALTPSELTDLLDERFEILKVESDENEYTNLWVQKR